MTKYRPQPGDLRFGRSKLSNGAHVIAGIDQRTAIARRYKDILRAVCADQGGDEQLSETRKQLIRRLAGAAVLAEEMETRIAQKQEINVAEYATLASTIVRISQRLGIDRRMRTVAPSLAEYLTETYPKSEAAE
jgi:hypothetical protein